MYVSHVLVGILVVVFLIQLSVDGFTDAFKFNPGSLEWYQFITSMFLHSEESIAHLFYNSFALIIFGPYLERTVGQRNFIVLFFLAGIAGSVLYYVTIVLHIIDPIPALGASGAIYGILGALAVLTPTLVIYFYFVPMPIRYAAVLWIIFETIGSFNAASGIGSAAHLGGLLFGILYGMWLKSKMSPPSATTDQWYSNYIR